MLVRFADLVGEILYRLQVVLNLIPHLSVNPSSTDGRFGVGDKYVNIGLQLYWGGPPQVLQLKYHVAVPALIWAVARHLLAVRGYLVGCQAGGYRRGAGSATCHSDLAGSGRSRARGATRRHAALPARRRPTRGGAAGRAEPGGPDGSRACTGPGAVRASRAVRTSGGVREGRAVGRAVRGRCTG